MKAILVAAVSAALILPAFAAERTVVLSVPTMDCPACPITIKKALGKVPGVSRTEVDYEKRQATVTFDDARTRVEALEKATNDAGYPSKPIASVK
jgi:mercuric ion binding protein